jgi:hypothetical protein
MRTVICLQIPKTFWIGGRTTSLLLNVHRVTDVKLIEIHTAELLIPHSTHFEIEIAATKLKRYELPGSGQIPAEIIQAGDEILYSKIHKLINYIWNKEDLPDHKENISRESHYVSSLAPWPSASNELYTLVLLRLCASFEVFVVQQFLHEANMSQYIIIIISVILII